MMRLKIAAFGDSLTAGSALHDGQKNWTDILSEELLAEVKNFGIGGQTTADALPRMEADVLAWKPDLVLICFGMNDHVIIDASGRTKVSEAQLAANLSEMVMWVREIGAMPVLMTPNAVMEEYYFTRHPREWYAAAGGANGQLARYCAVIRGVANAQDVPLVDLFCESRKRDLSALLRTPENGGFADGVHPYGEGIRFYADAVLAVLRNARRAG